jgi:hypothetical protein
MLLRFLGVSSVRSFSGNIATLLCCQFLGSSLTTFQTTFARVFFPRIKRIVLNFPSRDSHNVNSVSDYVSRTRLALWSLGHARIIAQPDLDGTAISGWSDSN